MKKPINLFLSILATVVVCAAIYGGYEVLRLLKGYHDTEIIENSPFASRFPSLYPEKKNEIERWFLDQIPPGTERAKANAILGKSFSTDLTTGRIIVIDETGSLAGGDSTTVRLHFDKHGRFLSVELAQKFVYL